MQPAGRSIGWLSIILALSALALLATLQNNTNDERSTLLEWWKPTVGKDSTGPSSANVHDARQVRGRMSASEREPLSLKNAPSGQSELEATDDETSRTLNHIRHKVAARETQLDEEDDHFSEGELASRLGRAIDAHEKCRRHWPHLESLESAQEIRVHDARNNLEVANRGMERARKELIDAENLVMAARTEHMTYEKSRQDFQQFKQTYDSRKTVVDMRRGNMELYQKRENVMEDKLRDNRAALAKLKSMEKNLALAQDRIVELESREKVQLKQIETVTLKAHGINLVKGQKLAEISKKQAQKKQADDKKKHAVHPLLSQISDGIVVPSDEATKEGNKEKQGASGASLKQQIETLRAEAKKLSSEEVNAFATLPADETHLRQLRDDITKYAKKEDIDGTKTLVAQEQLKHDKKEQAPTKVINLDKDKLQLAQLNEQVDFARQRKAKKEIAVLEKKETEGPRISRALSSRREKIAALESVLRKQQSLKAAGVALSADGQATSSSPESSSSKGESPARVQQLTEVSATVKPKKVHQTHESRKQLQADLKQKNAQLHKIRGELLKIRSKIRPEKEKVAVDHEMLRSRTHELAHAQALVHAVEGRSTQKLFSEYDDRLRELHEERKKADGLLAKAERMLNIARLDTEHTSEAKKAALEELDYATDKLRKYQKLRAQSQHCQLQAWSTIRRLTHRARERKMLEDSDERKVEALRASHDDALKQELSQI